MNSYYNILMITILLYSCNCKEPTVVNAKYFIENFGQNAINEFDNVDITFENNFYIIDYLIDRYKLKLENNPKLILDNIKLRFNDRIRFIFQNNMTFSEFCTENKSDDIFYSFNFINGNNLDNPKKTAYYDIKNKINKFNQYGLREVTPEINCRNRISFFLKPRCGNNYHVVVYVKDTTNLYPSFWKYFFKSYYSIKINAKWYYYNYENYNKYSKIYSINELHRKTELNPCFGKQIINK
jgi:hypothetical protein